MRSGKKLITASNSTNYCEIESKFVKILIQYFFKETKA